MRRTVEDGAGVLMQATLAAYALVVILTGCKDSPIEPSVNYGRGACAVEADFCDGRIVQALDATTVRLWQDQANDYADAHYGEGTRVYPRVTWMPCFFEVRGICCAGYTESVNHIYVSTAQDWRTGPLVAHETLHCVYAARFGDFDPEHRRHYGW